jgi:6-phosphogluconolactonase (cycloisomerase 2 family)
MSSRRRRWMFAVVCTGSLAASLVVACEDESTPGAAPSLPEAGAPDTRAPGADANVPDVVADAGADVGTDAGDVFVTYLYVVDYDTGGIHGFVVDDAVGALTTVAGSPFAGSPSTFVIEGRDGVDALIASSESSKLRAYKIERATGALTNAPGSPYTIARANVYSASMDGEGKYLFVNAPNVDSTVAVFAIDPTTRALAEVSGSPFSVASGSLAQNAIHPQGKYLYVMGAENDSVYAAAIDASTGGLTAVSGSPYATGTGGGGFADNPQHGTVDLVGKHLYVGNYTAKSIATFSIADGGGLSTDAAANVPAPSGICVLVMHPSGKWLYVGGTAAAPDTRGYLVDQASGALSQVDAAALSAGDGCGLAFSSDGRFLYTTQSSSDGGLADLLVYAVDPTTGALSARPALTKTLPAPSGIVTVRLKKN